MRNTRKKFSNRTILKNTQVLLTKAVSVITVQDEVLRYYAAGGDDGGVMAKDLFKKMGVERAP